MFLCGDVVCPYETAGNHANRLREAVHPRECPQIANPVHCNTFRKAVPNPLQIHGFTPAAASISSRWASYHSAASRKSSLVATS